jgi:hypothetical protein
MESHRSKKQAGAAQKESARRGYKLEEIDHLPPETTARAGESDLAALLRPVYLAIRTLRSMRGMWKRSYG